MNVKELKQALERDSYILCAYPIKIYSHSELTQMTHSVIHPILSARQVLFLAFLA